MSPSRGDSDRRRRLTSWVGTVLTWARALGEFGATITFAGNLLGRTQTMPLAIYVNQSSGKMAEAIALSLVLVVVSLVVMVFRRRLAGGD